VTAEHGPPWPRLINRPSFPPFSNLALLARGNSSKLVTSAAHLNSANAKDSRSACRGRGVGCDSDLLVFEARADVAELLVDAEALLLLVVAVADVADEDRQPSHPRERHPLLLVRPPLEKPQPRSACRRARSGARVSEGGRNGPARRRCRRTTRSLTRRRRSSSVGAADLPA
jgi:hypothetical protein